MYHRQATSVAQGMTVHIKKVIESNELPVAVLKRQLADLAERS